MRILFLIFLLSSVFAGHLNKKLFNEIFSTIFNKQFIRIYTEPKYYNYFRNKKFILLRRCERADFVFGDISKCKNKPIFALSYKFYYLHPNAFGVFYYRKDRPQLKFKREVFIKFFHKIPQKLENFVE